MKENKNPTTTNLNALDNLKDQDIDYSDILELDDDFFKNAKLIELQPKP